MRGLPGPRWHGLRELVGRIIQGPVWRRRLLIAGLIIGTQAAALGVAYRAVLFHDRTLLTGSALVGTEGVAPPYGYPGAPPRAFNEVDAGASAWFLVPEIRKAHLEVTSGQLPLWNANVMLGAPLAASAQNGLFNPLMWPLVAFPTPAVWDVWLLLRLLLAGVLCTALACYLGLRPIPATIAGLVYVMSGVFQMRTTTIQTGVMAVLPLLILAAEYCLRKPSRRSSALLAVAVAATILFGMPEESFVCLAMGALYFLVRFAVEWRHHRRPPGAPVVYAAVGGGIVGILCSLPLILPLIEYLGLGWTSHAAGGYNALVAEDPRQLLRLVGPHWTLGSVRFQAGFAPLDNWFGIGAIFLALLGAFGQVFPRGVRALLVLTAVLVEAKIVGFPGWFNQLVGDLPIVNQIALWAYSGVLVSLAVALLAGAGLQRIQRGTVKGSHVIAVGVVLGAGVAVSAPAFLAGAPVAWRNVILTATILIAVVACGVLAARPGPRLRILGAISAAAVVTAELIVLATPTVPLAARFDPLTPTPTSQYLQRVMPSGSGRSYSATQILYPKTNQAFNLDDIRNLDAIYIERTYRYLKLFVDPGLYDRLDGFPPDAATYIHNSFLNALNVEYILVAPPLSNAAILPGDQFTLQAVPADGVGIYRNRDAAPRAQVIFNVVNAASEQGAAAIMQRPGFDPTTSAAVETDQSLPSSNAPPIPARIDSYTDNQVVITTQTSKPGTLVLADAYYPGWQAFVDGNTASIYPVNVALRGVVVAAGTHTVTMQYHPHSIEAGALGVPAGLLVFGVGGWAVPAVLEARRRLRPTRI